LLPWLGGFPRAVYFGGNSKIAAGAAANGLEFEERKVLTEYDVPPAF
jgi:hypothetical protein